MEKMTLKQWIVLNISMSTRLEELNGNKVVIVTSAGVFTGNLLRENSDSDGSKLFSGLLDGIECNSEELVDIEQVPNDGYVALEDATLDTNGTKYNFGNIIIFHDQIVGITLGNPEV